MQRLRRRVRSLGGRLQAPSSRTPAQGVGQTSGAGATKPRTEPLPDLEPLPDARYAMLVGAVPPNPGGRTAAILTRCRLLKEVGGVDSTIVTLNYNPRLNLVRDDLRRRGRLVEGVTIANLHEHLRGRPDPSLPTVRHHVDEPGMDKSGDPDGQVYRYFENGVYRLYQRFDRDGRLVVRDWFNENRVRTRRDEFDLDGRLSRTQYMDLQHNRPRQQVFFRTDGSPYLNKWLTLHPTTHATKVVRATLFDEEGRPTTVLPDDITLAQHFLDDLFGDAHVFLTVDSRRADREAGTYERPHVKQLPVLHNPHLVPPGRDLTRIRPSYRSVFDRRDRLAAVVFLTNAQRADAEAVFGERQTFRVIPHPAVPAPPVPFDQRDPDLVVMLARLDQQKQLPHAVEAFALVVRSRPTARLEIYGDGTDRPELQQQIERLGLQRSVVLAGYTKDPAAVYRRAALSLLTSKYEGYGLVLLESLTHGCPVVSYDVKYGPDEIVSHGVNGFLVEPGDRAALAARVVQVLSDTSLRRRLSEQAGAPRAEFSEHAFVARWSRLFRDLDAQGWG